MFKTLTLLTLLCDGPSRTVEQLAKIINTSKRSVYREIGLLRRCGFIIDTHGGKPMLRSYSKQYYDYREAWYFSEEERGLLWESVHGCSNTTPLKAHLLEKLSRRDPKRQPPMIHCDVDAARKVRAINNSIEWRQQVVLKNYRSGSSPTRDRVVEAVTWIADYHYLQAYDVDSQSMRCFVMERLDEVVPTRTAWQYEENHTPMNVDPFWMTGEEEEIITLELSTRALNLLHEEFPLSQGYVVEDSGSVERPYQTTLMIRQPQGAARFVMGMGRQCRVVDGERLKAYIRRERYDGGV